MIRRLVGARIKELRLEKALSQEKFALEVGLDRTYVASVENGKRNISILNLCKIWQALGISAENFFSSPIFKEFESGEKSTTKKKKLANTKRERSTVG